MELHADTIKILKLLIAAQTGTNAEKIVLKKSYNIYKVRGNGMMIIDSCKRFLGTCSCRSLANLATGSNIYIFIGPYYARRL